VLHAAVKGSNLAALKAFVAVCNSEQTNVKYCEVPLVARQDHEGRTALHTLLLKDRTQWMPGNCSQLLNTLLTCSDSSLTEALVKQDSTGKTVLHLATSAR
jgi:ankyrin repeat protein